MNSEYYIRNLNNDDIPDAMKLVLAEGWNQTERDWRLFIEKPYNRCKCLVADDQLVGTATSYRFSKNLAWVSMVLVDKNFRGKGFGKALMDAVLADLKDCRSIKLDATPAGEKVYEKLGFVKEYSVSRWICDSFNAEIPHNRNIAGIIEADLPKVIQLDKKVFGTERTDIIRSMTIHFPELTGILRMNGKTEGFAVGRRGNRFVQIGPVSATSDSGAKELVASILSGSKKQAIVLDVMDSKTGLAEWFTQLGFQQKRQFWRMYLNNNSETGKTDQQYVICGPEFG